MTMPGGNMIFLVMGTNRVSPKKIPLPFAIDSKK